ncbi:exodeoxyribonuclease V subunit beta [Thermomonas sp. XSG]|uniref:exodeoxyribonuclease V subunit beta n=1 Tax=Thermomonas sp. XSG TaxID=2771436 RepID=UPI00168068A5|nr:exodeoxyribonuclease V subunit beta [Thermomonas sp. XSG]QNU15044.1 exodeoxyribonuclease V subunit beta [Thermomonas sp. XSG]
MSLPAPDPYLHLPLDGVRLVEASAGTGKTYTLATLVTRLVVERGLRIGQVLAVTFTEAATQELRKRIRERLQLALALVDAAPAEDESAEAALTRAVLQRHRAAVGESDAALRRRLRQAAVEIDLAAIFTIHGFCARVLREHALEAGQGFDAPELLASDAELRKEIAADLWRQHSQTSEGADDLAALWKGGYEELAKDLPALLGGQVLLPPDAPLPADPLPRVQASGQALADGFRTHGDDFLDALRAALSNKVLNGQSYKLDWIEALWPAWRNWCDGGDFSVPPDARIERFAPETLRGKANKGKDAQVPASPLCGLITPYLNALHAQVEYRALRRAALLHRLREDARTRMAARKRERRVQGYDDLIDGVADALEGPHGDALAARLRAQYAVALVDEFQDTDTRQWRIFERVFGSGSSEPALFLIGDPKQAIYGFRGGDVHTYLEAAAVADHAPALAHNFRSRPALLTAIAALYQQAGEDAFVDPRIRFFEVEAGGKRADADFQRDGEPAPALTVWQAAPPSGLDAKGKPKSRWNAGEARALATRACTAAIHGVLTDARAGRALIEGRPVQPGDIAVLVRSHREALMIQQALAQLGIPAVAAGKLSLFATGEARELHALLLALLHGADDGRLRAALGTVLLGLDALAIDALERDGDTHRRWQLEAQRWRERLRGGGPLALVGDLCAAHGERLLALVDGERRLSNYLQLAELLQEAQRQALGLHGLVDWLGRAIAGADANDEAQLLRLESDARRVQIVTLHKSKGLEYPLVFLPFVGIGSNEKSPNRHCSVHLEGARRLHWKFETLPEADWTGASTTWKAEQRAEDARLLYVGLTRAEHALWIASGDFFAADRTALAKLLGDTDALQQAGIVFDAAPLPTDLPRLPPASDAAVPPAREATRALHNDWWVYSFSQLARAEAGGDTASAATLPAPGGHDEPENADDTAPVEAFDPRFAGNRYGVALHSALEHTDFATWGDWHPGEPAPADEADVIATALRGEGYGEDALDDGIALTTQLIGHTLTVALPEGTRLCDVPASERRPEIEFQFALQPVQVEALLALLHAHGIVRERDRFGARQRLEGLMTGLIDLTYRHGGKWYVLDYKSNRLPGYDDAGLQHAMAHSEYDLQALIYTLALHRWLRFRLGAGYDYARDFGGIRYLFCRGLDAGSAASPGIHAQRFPPELVHALDALFGHAEGVAA